MAKARAAVKAKKKSTGNDKGWWVGIITGIVIAIIVATGVWWFIGGGNTLGARNSMAAHLKEKYGKEFVVKNYRITDPSIGAPDTPKADAYAKGDKNDPSMVFGIRDLGVNKNGRHRYRDDYVSKLWQKEEYTRLYPILKTILRQEPDFTVEIQAGGPADEEVNKDNMLTFREGAEKYGDSINYALRISSIFYRQKIEDDKLTFSEQYIEILQQIDYTGDNEPTIAFSALFPDGRRYGFDMRRSELMFITSADQLLDKIKTVEGAN
jgi:hypothetical protein